jgi:hypothetical protein
MSMYLDREQNLFDKKCANIEHWKLCFFRLMQDAPAGSSIYLTIKIQLSFIPTKTQWTVPLTESEVAFAWDDIC